MKAQKKFQIAVLVCLLPFIALGAYLIVTDQGINFSAHSPYVSFFSMQERRSVEESAKTFARLEKEEAARVRKNERKDTTRARVVEAHSSSYNPQANSFEIWFGEYPATDSSEYSLGRTFVPVGSGDVNVVSRKIFDSLLVVVRDSDAYLFAGFVKR